MPFAPLIKWDVSWVLVVLAVQGQQWLPLCCESAACASPSTDHEHVRDYDHHLESSCPAFECTCHLGCI